MSRAHQVEDRDQLIEQIAGRPLTTVFPGKRETPATEPLLCVDQLSSARLEDISFTAHAGEVLGIAGFLGSGRSHLLGALFGVHDRSGTVGVNGTSIPGGSITRAIRAGITLVPEDRSTSGAFLGLSIADNLTAGAVGRYWNGLSMDSARERRDCDRLITEHSVKASSRDQPLGELSGGNQQKVVLARWLRRDPEVLLLDEPTQGVDAGARREIYHSIRRQTAKGATAVVVSSDFEELANLCDRVLVLADGRLTAELSGAAVTAQRLTRLCFVTPEGQRA
jgi:ribose transport system ATP-binding protein